MKLPNSKEGQKNNKNKNMDKQESNDDDSEEEKNNSKKKIESKPEKKKENIQQPKNEKNLKSQSEEESEEESEEKESEKIKQDSVQKRFSTLITPSLKVANTKNRHTLNHSDDPVFNIKKVKDLKNMYNKKCFISPNQAEVQIKAITELKYEDNTINETAKFSYLTKRKRRHKKLKVEKQSEHSISPSKKSNIYDSSDEDYPYDISQEMKNYKINQLNHYNYYAQNKKKYDKHLGAGINDSKEDKTDDKFLDSVNIKENMIKNDFREDRRGSNKEEDRQILNNVITGKKKNRGGNNNNNNNFNKVKVFRKNLINNNLSDDENDKNDKNKEEINNRANLNNKN